MTEPGGRWAEFQGRQAAVVAAKYPVLHALVYSDFGGGKSTFAATFAVAGPMLVMMFDRPGKDTPYFKVAREVGGSLADGVDALGTPYRDVVGADGSLVLRVEYYIDMDLQTPDAYRRFMLRKAGFYDEVRLELWTTAVLDSITFAELSARKYHQYVLNAASRDPRQWYGGSSDLIEETLLGQFAGLLTTNVVVTAHVDRDKDDVHGMMVNLPSMPGRRLFKSVPAAYPEVYRPYPHRGQDGKVVYMLQTRGDGLYPCATQIDAPDPCVPRYEALWSGWQE